MKWWVTEDIMTVKWWACRRHIEGTMGHREYFELYIPPLNALKKEKWGIRKRFFSLCPKAFYKSIIFKKIQ
ncbi:MAG: hypothetical protein IJP31_00760 [Lachnospiraceae bacterium]|nr:hypothetical protein [Lachnospiraceae bacterium]